MTSCIVINLANRADRMELMADQLDKLSLSFVRLEATKPEETKSAMNEAYWESWERPLRLAERACLLSHRSAWEIIAEQLDQVLVLEDDALLTKYVPEILDGISNWDFIDHLSLETRSRKKLLARFPIDQVKTPPKVHKIFELYQDRSGAAAYVLSPSGARKLLANSLLSAGLADAVICRCNQLLSFQVDPAAAIQIDQAVRYGVNPPIQTRSAIATIGSSEGLNKTFSHRRRRICSQVTMGLKRLRHYGAIRREVSFCSNDSVTVND